MLESRPLQNPLGCSTNPPLNCLCPSASHHQLLSTLFYSSGLLMGLPASMLDLQSTPTEEPEQTCERSLLYSETSNSACPILPHVNTEDLLLAQDIYLAGPNSFPPSLTSLTSSPTLLHPHSPLDHFSNTFLPQGLCTCCSLLSTPSPHTVTYFAPLFPPGLYSNLTSSERLSQISRSKIVIIRLFLFFLFCFQSLSDT